MSKKRLQIPEISALEAELERTRVKGRNERVVRGIIFTLVILAALFILVTNLWFPVFIVKGNSMSPAIDAGEVVVARKGSEFELGDVVALSYSGKLLVKRVIAEEGQWVDIDQDGNVYIDDELLDEPYVRDRALGDANIEFPYLVDDASYFIMGDHRSTSSDSRNQAVGCVVREQIVGKVKAVIWPLSKFRIME